MDEEEKELTDVEKLMALLPILDASVEAATQGSPPGSEIFFGIGIKRPDGTGTMVSHFDAYEVSMAIRTLLSKQPEAKVDPEDAKYDTDLGRIAKAALRGSVGSDTERWAKVASAVRDRIAEMSQESREKATEYGRDLMDGIQRECVTTFVIDTFGICKKCRSARLPDGDGELYCRCTPMDGVPDQVKPLLKALLDVT